MQEFQRTLEFAESVGAIAAFSVDLETQLVDVTSPLRTLWGLPDHVKQASLKDVFAWIHPDDRQRVAEARATALRTRQPYHVEFRVVSPSGTISRVQSDGDFIYDADGHAVRNIGVQRIVARAPGFDVLTDLLDRAAFIKRVASSTHTAGNDQSFAVIAFDLDHFTGINEAFGSSAGDAVLCTIAERLRKIAREGECFARTGGDHFLGLLQFDAGDANDAVARVAAVLSQPITVDAHAIEVTATFGVSVFPQDATDESLVAQANLAMTSLRNRGVSGVQRYEPEMHRVLAERHQLGSRLHRAIELEEFELAYQPIVDARTLHVRAGEALIRWNHPELGTVPPAAFLPVAREMGLMPEIDAWVMRHACHVFGEILRSSGDLQCIGVNVSAQFLLSPEFTDIVDEALRANAVPNNKLAVEITEQVLLDDRTQVLKTLNWLRRRGVIVALDDFGTGYNTLTYLKLYPIDVIKIDRSFVSDVEQFPYSRSVCSGILALAMELGLRVIAEGVETKAQEAFLRSLGCSRLQGFLYGKPMPKDEFMHRIGIASARRAS